jgi:hypothetical protein
MSNWNFFRLRMNINGETASSPPPAGTVRTIVFVAALTETTSTWSNILTPSVTGAKFYNWDNCASPVETGLTNSNAIIAQSGHTNSAAKYCLDFNSGGYYDWYLGSNTETGWMIRDIYNNTSLQTIISNAGGDSIGTGYYWSSSQSITDNRGITAKITANSSFSKSTTYAVRPQKTLVFSPTSQYSVGDLAFGGIIFKVSQLSWGNVCTP